MHYYCLFGQVWKKKKHSLEICWRWNKDAPKHPYSCLVQIPRGRQKCWRTGRSIYAVQLSTSTELYKTGTFEPKASGETSFQ